jgi:hypothetical protein
VSQDRIDDELQRWYDQFGSHHERLKRQLVDQLPTLPLVDAESTHAELQRWYQQFDGQHEKLKRELTAQLVDADPTTHDDMLDDELQGWYEQFGRNHEGLKQEFLAELTGMPAPKPTPKSTPAQLKKTSGLRMAFRIAASILFLAAAGSVLWNWTSQPAYALQEVFSRLRKADRLYLRGTGVSVTRDEYQLEIYVERPHSFWSTRWARIASGLSTGHRASNGHIRYQQMSPQGEDASLRRWTQSFVEEDLPIWSEIELETLLFEHIGSDLFYGAATSFEFKGRREFRGVDCDVFERRTHMASGNQRVYVDRDRLTPVGAVSFGYDRVTGEERIHWQIDEVLINPIEIPSHISFEPPSGYSIAAARSPIDRFKAELLLDDVDFYLPFALQIDGQAAALLCWATLRNDLEINPHANLTVEDVSFSFSRADGTVIPSDAAKLGSSNDGRTTWNWVLVSAADPAQGLQGVQVKASVSIQTVFPDRTSMHIREVFKMPIALDDSKIQQVLRLLSAESGDVTLSQIRTVRAAASLH